MPSPIKPPPSPIFPPFAPPTVETSRSTLPTAARNKNRRSWLKRSVTKWVTAKHVYGADDVAELRVLVLTWNIGHKQPDQDELAHWLPLHGEGYDLVVIGSQENPSPKKKKKGKKAQRRATSGASLDDTVMEETELGRSSVASASAAAV